jgi:hypothetical protein
MDHHDIHVYTMDIMIANLDFQIDSSPTTEMFIDGNIIYKSVTKPNYAVSRY